MHRKAALFWGIYVLCLLAVLEFGARIVLRKINPPPGADATAVPMIETDGETIWKYRKNYEFSYSVDGKPVHSATNSRGVHDREWTAVRLQRPRRILAVGDSFTFGWGVPIESTWWSQLRTDLNADTLGDVWDSFGIGMWMSTYDQHYLMTKRYFDAIKPQYVIHAVYVPHLLTILSHNQTQNARGELASVSDPVVAVEDHRLVYRLAGSGLYVQPRFPYIITLAKSLYQRYTFFSNYREITGLSRQLSYTDTLRPQRRHDFRVAFDRLFSAMRMMHELAAASNARYVVVLIPYAGNVIAERAPDRKYDYLHSSYPYGEVLDFCRANAMECVDPLDAFRRHERPSDLYFRTDPHFTAAGHQLLARQVSETLRRLDGRSGQQAVRPGAH